jgi:hypothetical protein
LEVEESGLAGGLVGVSKGNMGVTSSITMIAVVEVAGLN